MLLGKHYTCIIWWYERCLCSSIYRSKDRFYTSDISFSFC